MPVKFISLSSGSNGNCYVIFNGECSVMIDAGVGIRKTKNALKAAGLSLDDIDMILVTHDHSDHIRHLSRFVKRHAPFSPGRPRPSAWQRHPDGA